jgi:hypothetical protein
MASHLSGLARLIGQEGSGVSCAPILHRSQSRSAKPHYRAIAKGFRPSHPEFAYWLSVSWLVTIVASVCGRQKRHAIHLPATLE